MPLQGQNVVKLGKSFKNNVKSNFVTFQYDFIPDSVDKDQPGEVTVESDNSICVNLPNKSGSYTQYKGTFRDSLKDCVLLVNKKTGEMTLEKLDYIVNLKNTRTPVSRTKKKSSSVENSSDSSSDESVKTMVNKSIHDNSNDCDTQLNLSDDLFGDFDSGEDNNTKYREPSPKKKSNNNIDLFDFPQSSVVSGNNKHQPMETNQHNLLFGSSNKTNKNKPVEIDPSLYDELDYTDSDSEMKDVEEDNEEDNEETKVNVVKDDLALTDSDSASGGDFDSD